MPEITLGMITALRKQTDASIADCQKALKHAQGDIDKALQLLVKNGAMLIDSDADEAELDRYLGYELRSAVMAGNFKALGKLLEQNVDINYNKSDMVHPFGGTPLYVAALFGNMEMVKYLIERGASVETADARGIRPYTVALQNNGKDIADYLKTLEPEEFHDLDSKLNQLGAYALPQSLIAFLQSGDLRIVFPPNEYDLKEVEFYSLVDTVETEFLGKILLLISKDIDGACCELVWDAEEKRIGYIDVEHGFYNTVCTFEDFMENPADIVLRIADGEYSINASIDA